MPVLQPEFRPLLEALAAADVRFIVIGGVAMTLHGSAHVTVDLDVCYARDGANLQAVVDGLETHDPMLRVAGGGVPFLWDARTLRNGLNFTIQTDIGDIDLLGEAAGTDSFEGLWERSVEMDIGGVRVHVASIPDLISMKKAANRIKDQLHVLELEALHKLLTEREAPPQS